MKTIYLDNNATTKVAPEVIHAMLPFLEKHWGNPSSLHSFGGEVGRHIESAREQMATLIGSKRPSEIVITSCGTESDNTAIMSALHTQSQKKHIVTTAVEHPAVRSLTKDLANNGYEITELPVDGQGRLDLDGLRNSLRPDTAIVSIMWANNETGNIYPVEEIANICSGKGVIFHTDAVQAAGKTTIDVSKIPVDFLSISGHKFHAPKGVGFLYVRKGLKFHPLILGGHHERGRRGGTENVASIIGMGEASKLALESMDEENSRVGALRDKLEKGIIKSVPDAYINGDTKNRLPNTTNISFEFVEGEAILLSLNEFGICASSGSACTSGSLEPSHVLKAMSIPFTRAHGSIRFSLSRYNTEEEIDFVLKEFPAVIERLRQISPFSKPSR